MENQGLKRGERYPVIYTFKTIVKKLKDSKKWYAFLSHWPYQPPYQGFVVTTSQYRYPLHETSQYQLQKNTYKEEENDCKIAEYCEAIQNLYSTRCLCRLLAITQIVYIDFYEYSIFISLHSGGVVSRFTINLKEIVVDGTDNKRPPYALIGSLNGVHVFGESHGVTLCTTRTQHACLTWKTYHDSIRLVLVRGSETTGDSSDGSLLDLMFSSLVLLLGLDTITSATNIERLKRDMRPCYALLDELLYRAVGWENHQGFSHLTGCAECVIPTDHQTLQNEVEKFAESADSTYGCIMMQGQVVSGTRNFWTLSHTELVLLPLLISTNTFTVARDLPIYLPNKSPNVPFRMLVVQLTSQVCVVTLCGPTPSLADMIRSATSFWAPSYQVLEALTSLLPWNIAPSLLTQLDNSVIGLLLVNYDHKRCVACLHLSEDSRSRSMCVTKKSAALQSVYRSVIGPLLQPPAMPPEDFPTGLHPDHVPLESYISTDSYKVYVLQSSPYHLLVLFPPAIPIHIARQVSKRALAVFTKGKNPKI